MISPPAANVVGAAKTEALLPCWKNSPRQHRFLGAAGKFARIFTAAGKHRKEACAGISAALLERHV